MNSSDAIHEVDMEVVIVLDDASVVVISWAMDGVLEGIGLDIEPEAKSIPRDDETDVTATPRWLHLSGQSVGEFGSAWHIPNEGCPETLWAVRLSLNGGSVVAIGLDELEDGTVQY